MDDGERYYNLETLHDLDFRCLCKRCQHNYAMTPQDDDLLRELGIVWGEPPDVHG